MRYTRRGFLRGTGLIAGSLGLAGAAVRPAIAKVAPHLVDYQTTPKGDQKCSNCKWFEPPNACKLVDGVISPDGWCKLWVKA